MGSIARGGRIALLGWVAFAGYAVAACSKATRSDGRGAEAGPPAESDEPNRGSGTIEGRVIFSGKAPEPSEIARQADPVCAAKSMKSNEVVVGPGGALRDVLVRIVPFAVKGKFVAPAEPVLVKQENCMYVPRVQGAMAGQVVQVENTDKTMHNVHTYRGQETVLNQGQPAGAPPLRKADITTEPAVFKFKCDVHPWMTGYLVVTDHPFFQTTADSGAFRLANVPVGRYTLEAWHPKYGLKTSPVVVTRDQATSVEFTFDGTEKGD